MKFEYLMHNTLDPDRNVWFRWTWIATYDIKTGYNYTTEFGISTNLYGISLIYDSEDAMFDAFRAYCTIKKLS